MNFCHDYISTNKHAQESNKNTMANFKDAANFDSITKSLEKLQKGSFKDVDTRFWQPVTDKAGNGAATIRFLPTPPSDIPNGAPWVLLYSYSFQGPTGKWYIENSPTTIGMADPVAEENSKLWKAGDEDQARARSRRATYISNIFIVNDPSNPENNGKVFLFRYGKKIFEKIQEAMKPTFGDEKPVNIWDLEKGANFKLRIVKKDGYRNYDKSSFESQAPLSKNDDELNDVWQKEYPLLPFIASDQFKSYEELKKKFIETISEGNFLDRTESYRPSVEEELDDEIPFTGSSVTTSSEEEKDDPNLEYFKKLAEEA